MQKVDVVFSPGIPPDLEHASLIREEAFDWLDSRYTGVESFKTGDVLAMAGQQGKRWLIARLRERGIGNDELFGLPATADALTVLFLHSKGVKFREAVDTVVGREDGARGVEPKYGGVWNRLIVVALRRLRRHVPARLFAGAIFSLIPDPKDHSNCLLVVKRQSSGVDLNGSDKPRTVSHDYVFRSILERPAPSCSIVAPSLEVVFFGSEQLPSRAEVRARQFVRLQVTTEREVYELLLGTMRPVSVSSDSSTVEFVGRLLDIALLDFEHFHRTKSDARLEAAIQPEPGFADDLQLWLIAQLVGSIYPGSLCEINGASDTPYGGRVLASSAANPWEPSPWDPPRGLEMLSGYASRVGVPLVVEKVEHPWTLVVKSVEPEMRYLRSHASDDSGTDDYSAVALPIILSSGDSIGALYTLMPQFDAPRLELEVRILTLFSRMIGEIIERQTAAAHSAVVAANVATFAILDQEQFRSALLDLLSRTADEILENEHLQGDVRLPFLLLSADRPVPDEYGPAVSVRLREWLVENLRHLEWRSFVRAHLSDALEDSGAQSFMGELPTVGMVIALGKLVSKDELDRIRSAFPTTINRTYPTNAPAKLVAWVLDVPAKRVLDAAKADDLRGLADDVERWAFNVASVVDDVDMSFRLAHDQGEWDSALRRVRKALQKEGGRTNSYLYRIAAESSFSLGDWPSALRYAQEGAKLSRNELGAGFIRSICQEADAHLFMCDPVHALDLYSEASVQTPTHPLPRYYRGQGLLLMARLLRVYEDERRMNMRLDDAEAEQISAVLNTLTEGAMDDLTLAADLLDQWGLIPESYQYRNFHLVPTLMAQGVAYMLSGSPGPAAARLQGARRSFPKDDLFFREFIFAKCWEQGLHRRYGELLLSDDWVPLRDRLQAAFGEPGS